MSMRLRVGDIFEYSLSPGTVYKVTAVDGDRIGYAVKNGINKFTRVGTFILSHHTSRIKILSRGKTYPQRKAV